MAKDHEIEIISGVTEKILTHELGAGSPCLKCGDACPGLDLHFWRKICRNCKCKQEDHDVQSSISSKGIDNIGKLLKQDKEIHHMTETDPIKPPSPKKSPKKQLPSPPAYVQPEPVVVKSAQPALEPILTATPPAPEPVVVVGAPEPEVVEDQLVAPELPKVAAPPTAPKPYRKVEPVFEPKANGNSSSTPKVVLSLGSDDIKEKEEGEFWPAPPTPVAAPELDIDDSLPPPPASFEIAEEKKIEEVTVETAAEKLKDVTINSAQAKSRTISSSSSSSSSDSSDDDEGETYNKKTLEWMPSNIDAKLLEAYMNGLPHDKRPLTGDSGAQYRKKQLMRQLPSHDQNPDECHDLSEAEKREMEVFVKHYRERALGVARVAENDGLANCAGCDCELKQGEPIVLAERAGELKAWKPGCFVCCECKELLVDLIYFYHDDKLYCGRHYCELMKPRCTACDELIFAQEYTQAEDSFWHLKHFCCWQCDQPLGGKNYVPHDNQPICVPCYELQFAHTCSTCNNKIAPNTEWVTFEKWHWHASDDCFKCSQCEVSLVGQKCIPKGEMVFCSSKCKKLSASAATTS